jgi:hypothetical protein
MAFRLPQMNFGGYYNEPEVNPIDVALKLLGHEAGLKSEAEQRGFEREKFGAEQKQAADLLGLKEKEFGETQLTGTQARKLAEQADIRAGTKQESDIKQKQFEDETARQKLIADAVDKVATIPNLNPETIAMLSQLPGMKEPLEKIGHGREMEKWLPQIQAAYATRGNDPRTQAISKLYPQLPEYVRQNAPWQDLNALIPEEKPGFFSRFRGGGGGPATPTPQTTEYTPEWQAGGGAAPEYRPEWQAPQAPPPTPQTQPTASQPEVSPPPLYETPYTNEADIANRINTDPRFQPAEDVLAQKLKAWWNQPPAPQISPGSFPSVEDLIARSQYQAPPEPVPQAREPGFVDWLMGLIGNVQQQNVAATQELPWTYGNPLPGSQPLPTPYPQPGLQDILR